MNSRESAHQEDQEALNALERWPRWVIAACIAFLVASPGVVYGIVNNYTTSQIQQGLESERQAVRSAQAAAAAAQAAADSARQQARAACGAYKLLAESPLTPTASPIAVNIAVAMRVAYVRDECTDGTLAPPDPRVAALLPSDVH